MCTPRGELVLCTVGEHCEIVPNGVFLMGTSDCRGCSSSPPWRRARARASTSTMVHSGHSPARMSTCTAARLGRLRGLLVPGGVLRIWAAYRSEEFAAALVEQLRSVEVLTVPVARGDPDVVYLARRYAE